MPPRLVAILALVLPVATACESAPPAGPAAPETAVIEEAPAEAAAAPIPSPAPRPSESARASGYVVAGGPAAAVAADAAAAMIGESIGGWIDRRHHGAMALATARAAETPAGRRVFWEKREADGSVSASGWAMASGNASSADGRVCRPVRQAVTQGGETRRADLMVCRLPDGSWTRSA